MRYIVEKSAARLFGFAVSVHINGHVSSQNNRYWCAENRTLTREAPICGGKLGVWCAVSATRIIGAFFIIIFRETKNWHRCDKFLTRFLLSMPDCCGDWSFFPVKNSLHSKEHYVLFIECFGDRIWKGWLCSRSLDLYPCRIYLWSMFQDRIYKLVNITMKINLKKHFHNVASYVL
jgi:hypothetical protein